MQRRSSILIMMLLFALSSTLPAQEVLTERNIFDIQQVVEAAVSPDARHIAYTVLVPRPFSDNPGGDYRELHVYDLQTGTTRPFITGKRLMFNLGWMPDSRMITFVANFPDASGPQVYGMPIDGGEARPLTASASGILGYTIHPEGTAIAYIATEATDPNEKKLRAQGFNAEVYEELNPDRNVYVRSLPDGDTRRLTYNVSAFSIVWSPDARHIAAAVAPKNTVDQSYMFKRIHLLDPEDGTLTEFVENPGKLGRMVWSPDGSKLAFVAGVAVWDSKDGSIFVADVNDRKPFNTLRNYSDKFEGTVTGVAWKDAQTMLFTAQEGVDITLREQRLDAADSRVLLEAGRLNITGFSTAGSVITMTGNTPSHPTELFTFDGKTLVRRTKHNDWLDDIRLARQERFLYNATDGLEITSILIYPLNYQEGKTYPLIVDIHGGPESAYQNGWVTRYGNWGQVAAARDYFVFMPNYRASTGRGVEFAKMGLGDLAGKEFDDVLDGIDVLIEKGFVDRDRVGIGGGSYGGYFSAWAATRHTERFAAAVSFVGVSNQISKRNTTDIPWEDYYVHWDTWTHEDVEKVYDRSPVKWARGSTTPTLILHGKDDPRVHPSQSLELYRALALHGEAPVRLIWYPGEGHGNRRNPARLDYIMRTMAWFDHFLKSDAKGMPPATLDYQID
ncbi:MAG: S9 family peptidase [Bacteroidetes bacterium]|nr:S9 family peptidase [Bacteroidota bacterium]